MPLRSTISNPATVVGEIFREAGTAFNKLSEMTMLLHPVGDSQNGSKWTDEEIEMLRGCVHRFSLDLNKLSQHIKSRTVSQIRTTLKKKAFEDAGIPVRQCSTSSFVANVAQSEDSFDSADEVDDVDDDDEGDSPPEPKVVVYDYALRTESNSNSRKRVRVKHTPVRNVVPPPRPAQNVDDDVFVTLNMLNASESEVDVEGLSGDVKLEFEGSTDEIST